MNKHTLQTHTRSSGQPFMLRRPGSSWGFGALLKGTSVLERALVIHSPHLQFLPDLRLDLWVTSPTHYPLGHDCPKRLHHAVLKPTTQQATGFGASGLAECTTQLMQKRRRSRLVRDHISMYTNDSDHASTLHMADNTLYKWFSLCLSDDHDAYHTY